MKTDQVNYEEVICVHSREYCCHHSSVWGQQINANFFYTKFFDKPSGRPRRKSWMSAPKSAFSCGLGGGEKLFDPWASGRKGQECPREIRTMTQSVFVQNRERKSTFGKHFRIPSWPKLLQNNSLKQFFL